MELVPGEALKGPLPLETALDYARQIAQALQAAHEKGIVHRDLKSANIMVTPEGVVKVLDFGLAAIVPGGGAADSSTRTASVTRDGVILGTVAYMSPEQARGKPVDKRTDIWAFGVVLYEMLAGVQLFKGETTTDVLSAVMTQEIDWGQVPERTRPLLRRCLERDPKKRLRDIGDMDALLEASPELSHPHRWSYRIAIAVIAVVCLVLGLLFWRAHQPVQHPLMRFNADLGPDAIDDSGNGSMPVLSPNGTRIAYVVRRPGGGQQIATRLVSQPSAVVLPGTEDAWAPFFSPDGQWLGFVSGFKLKKMPIQGGPSSTLCDAPAMRGAWWGNDGYIYASLTFGGGISRIPEGGGTPQHLTDPAATGEATHRWPQLLPGGQAVLFTGHTITDNYDEAKIEVLPLKTGKWKIVQSGGYFGRYLPTGHLLYINQSNLYAVFSWLTKVSYQLWTLPLDLHDPDKPIAAASQPIMEATAMQPEFSPDGRWIAFITDEVRVRPYPPPGNGDSPEWQISSGGGRFPMWSRTSRELFYQTPDDRIMVVPYTTGTDSFAASQPRLWSKKAYPEMARFCCSQSNAGISPDGKRFVLPELGEHSKSPLDVQVLLNFSDELRRRVPVP